jgi:hypothetical protein
MTSHVEWRHRRTMKHHTHYLRNWRCQHFPFTEENMCVPSHNALRGVHRKLAKPFWALLTWTFALIKSSEKWITAHMSVCLHYIRRITIVQSNTGLKQFLRRVIVWLQTTYRSYYSWSSLLSRHILMIALIGRYITVNLRQLHAEN